MKTAAIIITTLFLMLGSVNAQKVNLFDLNKKNWTTIKETNTYILSSKVENCNHKKLNDWDFVTFKIENKTNNDLNISFFIDLTYSDNKVKTRHFKTTILPKSIYKSDCSVDKDGNMIYSVFKRDYVNKTKEKLLYFEINDK